MKNLRFAVCGAGFWSRYQLAAWQELSQVNCVAICDPDQDKAESLARQFRVPRTYRDIREMLANESVDFVDVISSPSSHEAIVRVASENRIPVICQKPMAEDLQACQRMANGCSETNTWFAIHENWRWQSTLRRVTQLLAENRIGSVFRCRIDFVTGFDVFENQPTLRDCKQFIIADLGCHLLDYARSLFGEAISLYCRTSRVSEEISGEDAATISMWMNQGQTMVDLNLAYARTPLEDDCFPQTRLFAEGRSGSIELLSNYRLRVTTSTGTREEVVTPDFFAWANPKYAIVHSSMVACNRHFLECIKEGKPAETNGSDNLRSMQLVFAAYESSLQNSVIDF